MEIRPVAYIKTEFSGKFGIPRQSGLVSGLRGRIVFEPQYRNPDALRELDGFSHIWLIWGFSANRPMDGWQPTVRPPRLGGNAHVGVFATRSPYRPNPLGLSCVEIDRIELSAEDGPVIIVRGADLMDGTPIYDIKPYIRYADSRQNAVCGYVDKIEKRVVKVVLPKEVADSIPDNSIIPVLTDTLRQDPRPSYHDDSQRVYGLRFMKYEVKFKVEDSVLTVTAVESLQD
ncbi:MAG: tRNA (N6-threonylcarbamoyladenosine(37)-N6)-methyltransferase TrmO [Bacteroidales bacterium]|nr:tRNA (N6-threonylcarbamoyladenosine(37)-N6)-methyltransferase TrmO [Bacteroidales bacterium]